MLLFQYTAQVSRGTATVRMEATELAAHYQYTAKQQKQHSVSVQLCLLKLLHKKKTKQQQYGDRQIASQQMQC